MTVDGSISTSVFVSAPFFLYQRANAAAAKAPNKTTTATEAPTAIPTVLLDSLGAELICPN
jgi:hypothetical protein